jgi:hypothetical protein
VFQNPLVKAYEGLCNAIGGIGLVVIGLLRIALTPWNFARNLVLSVSMSFYHATVQAELAEEKMKRDDFLK